MLDNGGTARRRMLASRGDAFGLMWAEWVAPAWTVVFLTVFELGTDGRVERMTTFDEEAIAAATDLLDEWYVESLEPEVGAAVSALFAAYKAFGRGDDAPLSRLLSADFRSDDHRFGSYGESDAAGFLAVMAGIKADVGDIRVVPLHVVDVSTAGMVHALSLRGTDATIGSVFEADVCVTVAWERGMLVTLDVFELSQLERARAQFDLRRLA